ncbi:MAG: 2-dehydropantoate 2-reductase [Acidobacteriia bacterium]|nr:2-dehydropantoate 2-reductase [Terriglobia bacterium]
MRIAVMGTGGVGGYFGGRLARAGEEVCFIARGEHLKTMLDQGLRIASVTGDFEIPIKPTPLPVGREGGPSEPSGTPVAFATDDPRTVGPVDLVIFCVKTYDTEAGSKAVFPLVGPTTLLLSLQNGVDSADKLGRDHGRNHVLGGATYIYTALTRPGVITHSGGPGKIIWGELDGSVSERISRIKESFDRAGITHEISQDIRRALWEKFAMICANGGMSALTRATLGEMLAREETRSMMEKAMREVVNVGTGEGIQFDGRFVEKTMKFLSTLEPNGRASLYTDLVNNRRMELASLNGRVVQLAKKHGIPVPMNFAIYAALLPHLK